MPHRWAGAEGWSGTWPLPPCLARPLEPGERRALAAILDTGLGPARVSRILSGHTDVRAALADVPRAADPARAAARLEACGARIVVPADDEYPPILRTIAGPPPALYVRGAPLSALVPAVAIVGSRACTAGAARFARILGEVFAASGLTVVSGLARGVDAAAHSGALDTGRTVAVLGTGVDRVYPAEHRRLAERIVSGGALVSEFPPGAGPRTWHFPARNRIVAGLCLATVVVEAGEGSGALITAGFALDEGREVFACTVAPCSPAGAGVRELLREGARLIVDPGDAAADVAELAERHGYDVAASTVGGGREPPPGEHRRVWEAVGDGATVDEVCVAAALDPSAAAAALAALELDGHVTADGAGRWMRAR